MQGKLPLDIRLSASPSKDTRQGISGRVEFNRAFSGSAEKLLSISDQLFGLVADVTFGCPLHTIVPIFLLGSG